MIYKNCIDACFETVKAGERCAFEGCKVSKDCTCGHEDIILCADACALVGRLTARGMCSKEMYQLCAKICEECAKHCETVDHEYAKTCAAAAKKCADACRQCQSDCEKCEKEQKVG